MWAGIGLVLNQIIIHCEARSNEAQYSVRGLTNRKAVNAFGLME